MIIGIGTDLADITRIRKAITQHTGRFLTRIFTPAEIRYCQSRKNAYEHFAARFAAKEAFLKAIGTGWGTSASPYWKDIEVGFDGSVPCLRLKGTAKGILHLLKAKKTHLSLSHTATLAIAVVIIEK